MQTLEQKLITKFEGTKVEMREALFKKWCEAKTVEEREELHATFRGMPLLTFLFTKSINGGRDV